MKRGFSNRQHEANGSRKEEAVDQSVATPSSASATSSTNVDELTARVSEHNGAGTKEATREMHDDGFFNRSQSALEPVESRLPGASEEAAFRKRLDKIKDRQWNIIMTPYHIPSANNAFIIVYYDIEDKDRHKAQLNDFQSADVFNHLRRRPAINPAAGEMSVATRDFAAGEVLLREWSLLLMPRSFVSDYKQLKQIIETAVGALDPARQMHFRSLANAWREDKGNWRGAAGDLHGVVSTNSVGLDTSPGGDELAYGGVFPGLSKINHSCRPNVHVNWDSTKMTIEVRALRPIKKNQEVTFSYIGDLLRPAAARQANLREGYNFTCQCDACTDSSSDERRAQIARLKPTSLREYTTWLAGADRASTNPKFTDDYLIDHAKLASALYMREQLSETDVPNGSLTHADTILACYLARCMKREAVFWAGKIRAREIAMSLPLTKYTTRALQEPEKHELWNGRVTYAGKEPLERV